jgi:hypothetical protein
VSEDPGREQPARPDANGDAFEDLGGDDGDGGAERRAAIGEQLEERDRTHPEPGGPGYDRPPPVPRASNKYAWAVGFLILMAAGVILFVTTIVNPNSGRAIQGPRAGSKLPAFAAPLASGNLSGEANVCQRRPCGKNAGPVPACEVRGRDVMNLCQLRTRPLVLTFAVTRGADCEPQVDRVERMKGEFPGVRFAVVMSGNKRGDTEQIVRRRGWTQPVGVDDDGAVVNLYGVGVCPVTVFAAPGGRVVETALGNLTEQQLRDKTRRLVERSRG